MRAGWKRSGTRPTRRRFARWRNACPCRRLNDHRSQLAPILFGVANFLPTGAPATRHTAARRYVKRLWNAWWKLRPDFEDRILPADAWRFHGVRPANHPHRRLGAAVALLKKHPKLMEKVVGAVESGGDPAKLFSEIRDEYWSHHFTLGGRTQSRASELIGLEPRAGNRRQHRAAVRRRLRGKQRRHQTVRGREGALLAIARRAVQQHRPPGQPASCSTIRRSRAAPSRPRANSRA